MEYLVHLVITTDDNHQLTERDIYKLIASISPVLKDGSTVEVEYANHEEVN